MLLELKPGRRFDFEWTKYEVFTGDFVLQATSSITKTGEMMELVRIVE